MNSALETLLAAAVKAPSGDNTQPWRFEVEGERIRFFVDPERDRSPMNAGQRMARLAVGAAVENVCRTARFNGWRVELDEPRGSALAEVCLADALTAGAVDPVVAARVTNRRLYDGKPIAADLLASLPRRTEDDDVRTLWLTDRQRLAELATLVGRADAVMFGASAIRQAFLANVRFDAPADAAVAEGLSLASLEVGPAERMALASLRWLPDWLVRWGGALRSFARHARRLVESSSGVCLVSAPDDGDAADLAAGRALQRAWLALTEAGLAAQPMMSLLVLDGIRTLGRDDVRTAIGMSLLDALAGELRRQLPEFGTGRPAFLLRFGTAPAPSGRTGRRELKIEDCRVQIEEPVPAICNRQSAICNSGGDS